MSDCQFAVVEFVQEKSVGVVPETWIETLEGVSSLIARYIFCK